MENKYHFVFFLLVFVQIQPLICLNQYIYIQPNVGRQFDGIGAISGGGVSLIQQSALQLGDTVSRGFAPTISGPYLYTEKMLLFLTN